MQMSWLVCAESCRLLVYDMGLNARHSYILRRVFQNMPTSDIHVRTFDYSLYPPHVQLSVDTRAWLPIILGHAMKEFGGLVLYLSNQVNVLKDFNKGIYVFAIWVYATTQCFASQIASPLIGIASVIVTLQLGKSWRAKASSRSMQTK